MAISIFLNGKKVDLYEKPVTRKIQIGEVSEVAQRKSSYSYTIQLPKTSRNIKILDMLGTIGNTSRKPFEKIEADYVVDSVYLVRKGSVVIRETSGFFQLNIVDGIRSLADLLGSKKLSDLPLEELNHILTTQEYVDSYQNTEGFIYGIANYGQGVTTSIKVEKQAPSIFTHTLFRRIFESNGLTLQGEFFTTNEDYLNEVITPSRGYDVEFESLVTVPKGTAETDVLSENRTEYEVFTYEEDFVLSDIDLLTGYILDGNLVISIAGTYKLDFSALYNSDPDINIGFRINGETVTFLFLESDFNQTKELSFTYTFAVGDVVSLYVFGSSPLLPQQGFDEYVVTYQVQVDLSLYLQTGGQLITPSMYIGEMNQIDFLKDVVNRFGLVLHPVQNSEEFRFGQLKEILNDKETAEDWTSKLAGIKSEKYKSGYAKANKANYQYPEEIVVPNNDGEMLINDLNANNEKSMFSSPFEIPNESFLLSGNKTYMLQVWREEIEDEVEVIVNAETPLKVMKIQRFDVSVTAKFFNETTGVTVTEDIPFLNLESMSMQYFLNTYYERFQSMIDNYRKLSLQLNLSVVDIYNLDFFRLKFLKQTGRFYYLNSVQDTTGKTASVEAIELSDFIDE